MKKPPPTPEGKLLRVLRISKLNGLSIALVSGLCALISLAFGDLLGAGVGILVSVGGLVELSGRKQLLHGDADGMRRLVRSQMMVLGVILVFAMSRLASFDLELALSNLTPDMRSALTEAGVDLAGMTPLLKLMFYTLWISVGLTTLIYQGGMALYYQRRTEVVKQALAARLRPVVAPPLLNANPEDWVT